MWTKRWQLFASINKCAVISLSNKSQPVSHINYMGGIAITCRDSQVNLGITVCNDLLFVLHINNIVSKDWKLAGTLFRGFLSHNLSTMR
jgi:hypothetical protein